VLTSLGLIAMMTAYAVRFSTADIYRVSSFHQLDAVLYKWRDIPAGRVSHLDEGDIGNQP